MTDTFEPHYETLPKSQLSLLPLLSPLRELHFTLYGGTALVLRLGHRVSVDFDFFSHLSISSEKELAGRLPFLSNSRIIQRAVNTLTYVTHDGVKLSFFGGIGYGRLGKTEITQDGILNVASTIDLMSTKLAALVQRLEAKDYIDIHALINSGESLMKGLCGVCTLFGDSMPPMEIARALTCFQGGDLHVLSEEVKSGLLRAAQGLVFSEIGPMPLASKKLDG